jgi:hypothetical protein
MGGQIANFYRGRKHTGRCPIHPAYCVTYEGCRACRAVEARRAGVPFPPPDDRMDESDRRLAKRIERETRPVRLPAEAVEEELPLISCFIDGGGYDG